ncbi:MAG: hypothetical protein HYY54_08150, partial [candidate division NC10 bacterium]|nr:hypothetical protein [candidate division NC10 bacterium]
DPDFNKRDSFHATIAHPHMTAEGWTRAYEEAWRTFYSKENLTRILSRWSQNPTVYWNLVFTLMWYKNAALIEKQHPMIAGFFRLKERRTRRPGFAIDPWPVHLWKRTKEVFRLFVAWARFLKEMEEIWLETRPRSEMERRVVERIERIQGEIWQTLRIAEWQQAYQEAKTALPARARALLDPFEDLSGRILLGPKDLDAFLEKWGGLQGRIQQLYRRVAGEEGPAKRWIDQLSHLHREAWQGTKAQEWREVYADLKEKLPSRLQLLYLKFDALGNRVVFSRQDLKDFWAGTRADLHEKRFWNIRPLRLIVALWKELRLTTAFARGVMASLSVSRGRVLQN